MFSRKKKIRRDWSHKKYGNPFFRDRRTGLRYGKNADWQKRLFFSVAIIAVAALVWFFFFSKIFEIRAVEISGNQRTGSEELQKIAWDQTMERRFLFGPQKNLFLFNKQELESTLNNKYVLSGLTIQKNLWGRVVKIRLTEKNYSLIWHEADKYYYINSDGTIINEINPLDIKIGEFPVAEKEGEPAISGRVVLNQSEKINFVLNLSDKLKRSPLALTAEKFIIGNKDDTSIKAVASSGPAIIFNLKDDPAKQIERLAILIKDKLKNDYKNKKLINLKFGEKIFWE